MHVGGSTASNVDLATKISQRMPIVVLTVIALSFLLLMVAFRSLLIPLQAAIVNLLTVAAALGVLTAMFQWGWGLSLDRARCAARHRADRELRAAYDVRRAVRALDGLRGLHGEPDRAASRRRRATATGGHVGLGAAAHVVVAAALIMFLVFASFIIKGDPTVKQFGVGLAAAVFLAGDMIVLLAPAMLTLFGRGVFWVPRWLGRLLPHIDIEGGVDVDKPSGEPGFGPEAAVEAASAPEARSG